MMSEMALKLVSACPRSDDIGLDPPHIIISGR